jgi:DinB superfamily
METQIMEKPSSLIRQVSEERARLVELVASLSAEQASHKPTPQTWSANENLEHLVLAEMSGVSKIWSAAEGVRKGKPVWSGEHTNRGLSIEEVVACTWKPKEIAPPLVAPRFGGPPSYWLESLRHSQQLLDRLEPVLDGLDIESVIFPHFLSGPLDAGQRIDFLRFHMLRHRGQIEEMLAHSDFSAN